MESISGTTSLLVNMDLNNADFQLFSCFMRKKRHTNNVFWVVIQSVNITFYVYMQCCVNGVIIYNQTYVQFNHLNPSEC